MNFMYGILLSVLFLFLAVVVLATKFLFPYHRYFAFSIYIIGWIPFLYSIYLRKNWLLKYKGQVTTFFAAYWIHLSFAVFLLVVLYLLLIFFPVQKSFFLNMSEQDVAKIVNDDKQIILYLNKRLENKLFDIKESGLLKTDVKDFKSHEKEDLLKFWQEYTEILFELDLLKEKYSTFYQLRFTLDKDLYKKVFNNGYISFVIQYYYSAKFVDLVSDHNLITFLNQEYKDYGIAQNTFSLLKTQLAKTRVMLRLNAGKIYFAELNQSENANDELAFIPDYLNQLDLSLSKYKELTWRRALGFLEKTSFKFWFPMQKEFAKKISYVRTSTRDYHISTKLIKKYQTDFLPGDIFLERREWHATNVGIPGYWTHTALYLDNLENLNKYFADFDKLDGLKFSEYIKDKYPEAYAKFSQSNKKGQEYAVIEAKRPGVIFTSLEDSANADSLAVLRVKDLDKEDRFNIIMKALSFWGKSYDFNFDFATDNVLVCSELVVKSYLDIAQLNVEPQELNGRYIFSPNQFAQKYHEEFNKEKAELELVLFLDGNEKMKKAIQKDEQAFSKTWQRPKWHIVKDFVSN